MPLLDKLTPDPEDEPDFNPPPHKKSSGFADLPMDRGNRKIPIPEMLPSREGRRQVSIGALMERIVDQFHEENTPDDSAIRAAETRADRIALLKPTVDYILSVESVDADPEQQTNITRMAYSEIFGFGPIDGFIDDEEVTTISLEGTEKVSIRRGHDELTPVPLIFEDNAHMKDIIGRMLKRAGAALREDMPLVEVGFHADNGRFVSMSMFAPPVVINLSADIRLHPLQSPTLDDLLERGTLTKQSVQLLRALMQSEYGFTLVGQPESGKTMTLSALLTELPNPAQTIAIERTGELHLPEGMARAVVHWDDGDGSNYVSFGQRIEEHAEGDYTTLVLDEVRADEPHTIAPLLRTDSPKTPRLIWSFRGAPDSKRLISSLGMLARRADVAEGEALVRNLFERMPFVVTVRRLNGKIELRSVAEWVYPEGSDNVQLRDLLKTSGGETELTGEKPSHALPGLAASFWKV
ncbi:MAG: ATPase, T2SS/T4P/T4SS family [Chloroflexota bacterium]